MDRAAPLAGRFICSGLPVTRNSQPKDETSLVRNERCSVEDGIRNGALRLAPHARLALLAACDGSKLSQTRQTSGRAALCKQVDLADLQPPPM